MGNTVLHLKLYFSLGIIHVNKCPSMPSIRGDIREKALDQARPRGGSNEPPFFREFFVL